MTQQLEHLAAAYFHQDFDVNSGSPTQVVDAFLNGEGEASAAELVSEIDRLLASSLTEQELRDLWLDEWGAFYDPHDDGQEMRGWFAEVRLRASSGTA